MRNRALSPDRGVGLSSAVLILHCWACGGCSHQPPRDVPPAIDPAAAGQAAIELYDTNHDGALSGAELNQCPSIKSALSNYDAGSGKVTPDSIAARIRQWQESKIGTMGLNVIVMLDGQELDGATVTLEPEKFLGPNLAEASGVSSAHGMTPLRTKDKPGVHLGLYKVLVSKVIDGKETIPAKFNTATTIGIEVAPTGAAGPPPVVPTFKLTSK